MTTQEMKEAILRKERYDFEDLRRIMEILRSKEGCVWDREQDHHSIRSSLIEEAYEVIEAIDTDDPVLLREELGDLLFQIVFHTCLEEEQGSFTMDDVIHDISFKMIHRHPHVFSTVKVENSEEVLSNWEAIKTEEKQRNTLVDRLRAVPPMLPALMRAAKISKKAELYQNREKDEILNELHKQIDAIAETDKPSQKEIGALLMGVIHLCGKAGVDAEEALSREIDRVIDKIAEN
ncbi:MAG: MazG family protein [Clostridia bacterium]|nr:MazG family protein [Clostridia bacterium]